MALNYIVNGSPVEVKKHQIMGPVGYEVVGSPMITDGVLSNCGASSYLQTSSQIPSNTTEIEGSVVFNCQYLISPDNLAMLVLPNKIRIGTDVTTGKFGIRYYENGTSNDILLDTVLQRNTTYKAQFTISASSISISLYQGNTLLETKTATISYTVPTSGDLRIGQAGDSSYLQYSSIDLNQTYIKVNGYLWFYQPAPSKYIVKDDKLVFADQGLYLSGPVNYKVVGNPTIVDGVASGFGSGKSISLSSMITFPADTPFELMIKAKPTNSNITDSDGEGLFYFGICNSPITYNSSLYVASGDGTTLGLRLPSVLMGVLNKTFSNALTLNTYNYIQISRDASNTFMIKVSTDKENWNTLFTNPNAGSVVVFQNTYPLIGAREGNQKNFTGFIDLNETYIKVNDQLWFYGKNYASKNIAPVPANYTYGTTTTSAIGYVDMRTQEFTAAPTGATIGRDE